MTIELSSQLESALTNEAARRGTTPQSLAVQLIESQLPQEKPQGDTLFDRLKKHVESLPAPSTETRPEWLRSDNVSEAVGKVLEERRRQRRL